MNVVIDSATTIGAVHLTVSDLDRSVGFYEAHVGLIAHHRDDRTARLGAGEADLLVLSQDPSAPRALGTTGLYHFALLVPSRAELARSLTRLLERRTELQGAADHGVSESLYLADPDGIGIEIYRDRPRGEWPMAGGHLRMGVDPLDLNGLLRDDTGGTAGLPRSTTMGHVHLQVSRLPESEHFYGSVLGFEVMQRYGPSALFLSAGGYHHHIGLNTWLGVGAPPPPAGAIGLRHFIVRLPTEAALAEVADRVRIADLAVEATSDGLLLRDPSGNTVLLSLTRA
jgi:catechol 2,3-dioxygenase